MATLYAQLQKLRNQKSQTSLKTRQFRTIEEFNDHPGLRKAIEGNPLALLEDLADINEPWAGMRSLLPHRKNEEYNQRVKEMEQITSGARGFRTEGVRVADNPITPALGYSTLTYAALQFAQSFTSVTDQTSIYVAAFAGLAGVVQGLIGEKKKHNQRWRALEEVDYLVDLCRTIYRRRTPLVERIGEIEEANSADKGAQIVEAFDQFSRHPGSAQPSFVDYVNGLWEKKWESSFTYLPRFFASLYPSKRDNAYNDEVEDAAKIFPNAKDGFRTRGLSAVDNPVGGFIKRGATVYVLGKTLQATAQYFGIEMHPQDQHLYSLVLDSIALFAGWLGIAEGGYKARQQFNYRKETLEQARYLDQVRERVQKAL